MKKYIVILLAVSFILTGCQDYLNLKPKNQVVVNTMEDVKMMMSSYLFSLTSSGDFPITFNGNEMRCPFNRDALANMVMYGDDLDMTSAQRNSYGKKYQNEYFEDVDWKGHLFASFFWRQCYLHVGYMNSVLEALEEVEANDKAEFEKIRGEALTVRSFFLFKLLQLFAPYDNNELGIPVNFDPDAVTGGARLSQKEVYKRILDDLNEAMDMKTKSDNWNIFYNKDILHALLAQVYMFKAESAAADTDDWKNAEEHADYIVQNYALETTPEDLKSTITPVSAGARKTHPNALLSLAWSITPRSNVYSFWGASSTGQFPAEELRQLYTSGDMRPAVYFDATYGTFVKYSYVSGAAADYVVLFRVADLYLICAEANVRLGNDKGTQLLNDFKRTRINGFTTYDKNDVLDEIIRERRKEFCGEFDLRWLDMKRLNLPCVRWGLDEKSQGLKDYTLQPQDYRYALPIPMEEELAFNKIPQNPGWN